MELMIPLPLVLPDAPLDLAPLEEAVRAWGLQVQQQALALAWERQAALRPPASCPTCHGGDLRPAGRQPRQVETTFGPVWLARRRQRCRGCGRHFQPDDAVLSPAVGAGQCPPAVRELAALSGASWPYRSAARVLSRLRGSPVAPETIRQAVAQAGAMVAAQVAAEAQAACQPPPGAPDPTRPVPPRLVVELDGAWVRSHDNADGCPLGDGGEGGGGSQRGRARRAPPHAPARAALRRHAGRGGRLRPAGDGRGGAPQRRRGAAADAAGRRRRVGCPLGDGSWGRRS